MAERALVWAHRGASGYAPENTLAAFQEAIDMGADGIELDVQLTKDGQIVVIHDETVLDASYQNLMQGGEVVKLAKRFEEYESAQIPTMEEVFELIKPTKLWINIELKTGIVFYPKLEERIVEMTKKYGMEDRVIYSSFNHYSVEKIREIDPTAQTGLLYADGTIDMPSYGKKYGVKALHPALYNLQFPGFVEECMKEGLELNVWTVNEPQYVEMCKAAHVHAVITNYPDMAMEILNQGEKL